MREKEWDDIYSPRKGVVKYTLKTKSDYGRRVYIEFDNCILMFAHLKDYYVKEGQTVEAGELIGTMGNTGYSDDVHLHVSAFNKRAQKLTAAYTVDPTFILKLAECYVTNTKVSNGYGSKYCNPKLGRHEGLDFSGVHKIPGWETTKIIPIYQDYRLKKDYPKEYVV